MKITKINGLGSFGVYVDDFDYASVEAWQELERINLKYLITVVRNNGQPCFSDIVFGSPWIYRPRALPQTKFIEKYGRNWGNPSAFDHADSLAHQERPHMQIDEPVGRGLWTRISGERNEQGHIRGMFADTELLWHSNGSGDSCFSPLVMLYGQRSMLGSSTGFVVSADWFDQQSQSFQTELRDMVAIHQWQNHAIEPTGIESHEALLRPNFADWKPSEMPMVMTSPGGITGVHLGQGTISHIKGMTKEESDRLINHLRSELIAPQWSMDVWWPNDQGDLFLFDNSITLHNRTFEPGTDISEALQRRLGYRTSGDYRSALDWRPSEIEPWASDRESRIQLHYAMAEINDINLLNQLEANQSSCRINNYTDRIDELKSTWSSTAQEIAELSQQEKIESVLNKFAIQ